MMGVNLFMLWYGIKLVKATWYQWISDFPEVVSVGMSYLPVPIGGAITALFVIERLWIGVNSSSSPTSKKSATVSTE